MKYSEKTLEYYENLNNTGGFDENLKNVGTGIVGSPLCGDVMKLQLFFDENDIIIDAKYKVFGCVSAIASMELATTILKGKNITAALKIRNQDLADSLELTEIKRHCSVLAKEAIEMAINNYKDKQQNKNNMLINISKDALTKIKELLNEHKSKGIFISINQGGCSGIEYSLSYENEISNEISDNDNKKSSVEIDGIIFSYEKESELLINGLNIEIVENSFGHGFLVTNKNHFACQNCSCGCPK